MRNSAYVNGRTTWPIQEEKRRTRQIEGVLHFRYMKFNIKKTSREDRSTSAPLILDTSCKIFYHRTALGRKIRTNQGEHRVLTRRFQVSLKEDSRSRLRRVGEEI